MEQTDNKFAARKAALTQVYSEDFNRMVSFTTAAIGNGAYAEDVVQNTVMTMLKLAREGRLPTDVEECRKLFWTDLRNKQCDYQRRQGRDNKLFKKLVSNQPGEELVQDILDGHLPDLKLSEPDTQLLRLRFERDYDHKTIAQELGISESSARQKLHRIIKKIKQQIGDDSPHVSTEAKD